MLFKIFAVIMIGGGIFTLVGMAVVILLMAWRAGLTAWNREKQDRLARKQAIRPVGLDLATRVADRLDRGGVSGYWHRDYCGMGLAKKGNLYLYDMVYDGQFGEPESAERIFNDRELFIDWLRQQTDQSLAGDGNQRITTNRLRLFVEGILKPD